MNEQIKELGEKSGFGELKMLDFDDERSHDAYATYCKLEEYTKLVVAECAKCITSPTIQAQPPNDVAIKVLLDVLVDDMKYYFGVKE
jgi:hypothetical protein